VTDGGYPLSPPVGKRRVEGEASENRRRMPMKTKIDDLIGRYVENYPREKGTMTRWGRPLTAYAAAGDELFAKMKEIIDPSHGMPSDFLPGAQTVITYFLPFDGAVVKSNIEGRECSRAWAVAYHETNALIEDLNRHLKEALEELGHRGAAIPPTHNFDRDKLISGWSHRHAAFIAGLGKFGLNNMLITAKGCAGRVGSLVTDLALEPTSRSEGEYCLHKRGRPCGKCVRRCVNGALSIDSFDRHKCYAMCLANDERFPDIPVTDVCGKCLVAVPCAMTCPAEP
jgi:epoxyqueuosine reductase QueG